MFSGKNPNKSIDIIVSEAKDKEDTFTSLSPLLILLF